MNPDFFTSIKALYKSISPLLAQPRNKVVLVKKGLDNKGILITGNIMGLLSNIGIEEVETLVLRDWLEAFYKGNRDDIGSLLVLLMLFFEKVLL